MNEQQLEKDLKAILGDRSTVSPHDRWFHRNDLLKVPSRAQRLVRSTPDTVLAPETRRKWPPS